MGQRDEKLKPAKPNKNVGGKNKKQQGNISFKKGDIFE